MESGAKVFPQIVPDIAIRDAIDSVLTKYHNVRYNTNILSSFPFLTARHLRLARYGSCFDQVWLNTLILSGSGFAVGADMVPLWVNRNSSHTWNVVILDKGKILPIDAFLSYDRWELAKMYDNVSIDNMGWWGPFRLPKVFRYSYNVQKNEIVDCGKVAQEDIPPFFRLRHYVDVSDQYFRPTIVSVDLTEAPPKDARYVFLCCAQGKSWVPVAYGKIKNKRATFENVGRDIVYLPAYYKAGQVIPAGAPIYVDSSGTVQVLSTTKDMVQSMVLRRVYFMGQRFQDGNKALGGLEVYGAAKSDFSDSVLLARLPRVVDARPYIFDTVPNDKVRYVRFYQPSTSPITELSALDSKNQMIIPKRIEMPLADPDQKNRLSFLCDSAFNEIVHFRYRSLIPPKSFPVKIQYDLGRAQQVSRILFCGYKDTQGVEPEQSYELFCWDSNRWNSCGVRTAHDYTIRYDSVPTNTLYYLNAGDGTAGRVFLYKSSTQYFK